MKTTKTLIIAAAALPMIFASASVFAKGGDNSGKRSGQSEGFDKSLIRQLDLTDEQEDQLRDLRDAKRDEMKASREGNRGAHQAEMQQFHAATQDLVLADNFDEAKAEELARVMVEQQTERKVSMLKSQHEMLSILTAEQKAELKELQAERMQKMAERAANRKS